MRDDMTSARTQARVRRRPSTHRRALNSSAPTRRPVGAPSSTHRRALDQSAPTGAPARQQVPRQDRSAARVPGAPAAARARACEALDRLEREMPEARIALRFQDDVQLLTAVVLSAQSTDARVNLVTPALFARFPDARAFASAEPEELWPFIRSVGLFRSKARSLVAAMRAIASEHGGRVPRERAALEALPGVGPKTAGVVLIHLGAEEAFPVDTHVGRVARRLGFTRERDPGRVEERLRALIPRERWAQGHQLFVWHGRRTCGARSPACERCALADLCPKIGVGRR